MGDATTPTTELGRILVTGGSGFVGANLVTELLDRGLQVRSFDRVPSPLPGHPGLEVVQGDITDVDDVARAVGTGADKVDTVFHTAAIIDLMGGASVTEEYRQRSFAVNVTGTKNLVHAAQKAGVQRFVYTASNSVVMGGQRIAGGVALPDASGIAPIQAGFRAGPEHAVAVEEQRLDPRARNGRLSLRQELSILLALKQPGFLGGHPESAVAVAGNGADVVVEQPVGAAEDLHATVLVAVESTLLRADPDRTGGVLVQRIDLARRQTLRLAEYPEHRRSQAMQPGGRLSGAGISPAYR